MTILEPGIITKSEVPVTQFKRFRCSKCGCLFEADNTEYTIATTTLLSFCVCECPFCHEQAMDED